MALKENGFVSIRITQVSRRVGRCLVRIGRSNRAELAAEASDQITAKTSVNE